MTKPNLKAFMKKREAKTKELTFEGYEEPVVVKTVGSKQSNELMQVAMVKKGKKNEFDVGIYNTSLSIAGISSPDLNNQELQEFFGVFNARDLFHQMFNAGESARILEAVTEVSDLKDLEDLVEEAKN